MIRRLGVAVGRAMAGFAVAGAPGPNRTERRGGAAAMLDRALDHPQDRHAPPPRA